MFNLLIQFLPMPVTLPLCQGGQMEHAAQNTQTKSHFLSTSQFLSLAVSLASLCLSLTPSLTLSQPFCLATAFFSFFVTHSLIPTPHILQPCENKAFESSTSLKEFVTHRFCVCWSRSLFNQPDL